MSKRAASWAERGAVLASVANPAPPSKKTERKKKEEPMTIKKKKKKKPSSAKTSTSKKTPHARNPAPAGTVTIPRGMMLIPVGGTTHTKKKTRKKGHAPHKRNPGDALDRELAAQSPHHARLKSAAVSVGFGALAAALGMAGGVALSKAEIEGKGKNIAANLAAGTIVGAAVGAFDRTAGTLVAHNYFCVAGQWMTVDEGTGQARPTSAAQMRRAAAQQSLPAGGRVATPALLKRAAVPMGEYARMQGADELESVMADDMGGGDELGEYARIQGVIADDMGEADMDGIVADDMGGPLADEDHLDELGDDDMGDDELGEVTS